MTKIQGSIGDVLNKWKCITNDKLLNIHHHDQSDSRDNELAFVCDSYTAHFAHMHWTRTEIGFLDSFGARYQLVW